MFFITVQDITLQLKVFKTFRKTWKNNMYRFKSFVTKYLLFLLNILLYPV